MTPHHLIQETLDEWTTLKNAVSARHVEVEGQFESMTGNGGNAETDSYGGSKEQAALDANAQRVKGIRDSLVENNGDWRGMIDTVSADHESLSAVKKQMVDGLTSTAVEMKVLLDLVIKIPKRKILKQIAGAKSAEQQPDEEQAASEREQ